MHRASAAHTSLLLLVLVVALVGLLLAGRYAALAGPPGDVYTVNSALDSDDSTCDPAPGGCTLRDAIEEASFFASNPTINFDPTVFPANFSGPVIIPATPYPTLFADEVIGSVTVDGTGAGVIIDGVSDGGTGNGISFDSLPGHLTQNITVKNITMRNFVGKPLDVCAGAQAGGACVSDLENVDVENVQLLNNHWGVVVSAAVVDGVTIKNSTLSGAVNAPAYIVSTREMSNISITGSTITDNNDIRLRLDPLGDLDGVTISNNTVTHTGFYLNDQGAMSNLTITGNQVHDVAFYPGFDFEGGTGISGVTITGNTVQEAQYGLFFRASFGPLQGVTIQNNTLSNNVVQGIRFQGDRGSSASIMKGNTIHDNGEEGIWVAGYGGPTAPRMKITQNSIYANGRLGIDLLGQADPPDGVTPNDAGDADTGSNDLLNFPEIAADNGQLVTGAGCFHCLIELFVSDDDPSGYGEGKQYLAFGVVSGLNFAVLVCGLPLSVGDKLTATATDSLGNTSEFSQTYTLTNPSDATCATETPAPTPTGTITATPGPTASTAPTGSRQGDLDCDGTVTPRDALFPMLYKLDLPLLSRSQPCRSLANVKDGHKFADVNCDGVIDENDSEAIVAA